jgi:hypothetical protein
VRTDCRWCGGPIARRTNAAYSHDNQPGDGPWLHLHLEDWRDNPHNAEPRPLPVIGEVPA